MDTLITDIVKLLLSHLLTDFVLQPRSWVNHKMKHKGRSHWLYIHSFIAGVLAYLFVAQWDKWYILPIIAITHFLFDLWKLHQGPNNLKAFLLDQAAHLLILAGVWYSLHASNIDLAAWFQSAGLVKTLAVLCGLILITMPAGLTIGYFTQKWKNELDKKDELKSLHNAGRWIGILERLFIFIATMIGQPAAIGWLIAAKSIIRFSSMRNEVKMAEYVLVGTLLSFITAILISLLCKFTINIL